MTGDTYRDPTRSIEARVDDLLGRMSLDEKIAQLGGIWITDLLEDGRFSPALADARLRHGIGHVTRVAAATGFVPAESAAVANQVQAYLQARTRLKVPAVVHEEACAGYMARDATCFPQAIGQASTWDPGLIEAMGRVIATQMRAVGAHHALAPVLDLTRDPRWGRVEETYGEDPYLVARMGIAYIRGVQGVDLAEGVVATAKHFLGYGMSEGGLNWAPVRLMPRELLEVFAAPFEAAIQEAGVASAMNAYHEIDGVPCGASAELMVDLLRDRLGFAGTVVSDYFAIAMLHGYHRVAADKTEAAALGLRAGIDVELPAHDCYGDPLRLGLERGDVDPAWIDAAARRVLEQKFRLGLFERPLVDAARAPLVFGAPEARALARRMAQRSLVLLKNDGPLLPLREDLAAIALIGPGAADVRLLQGDYHYPAHVEVMFEAQGNLPAPTPMLAADAAGLADHFPPMVSLLAGLEARVGPGTRVLHARGCDVAGTSTDGFAEAVAAARRAEVAIVVVGDRSGLTNDATCGEARDRADVRLPGVQEALALAVAATGTPVVLVLLGGRPLALTELVGRVGAIVAAWLPGEEAGHAVAATLFGDESPGGKLPISFPRSSAQIPVYYGHKASGGRSHWKGDYVDMPTSPLFAFGHGLSYTEFAYADLRIEPAEVAPEGRVTVSLELRNAGTRAGDEVVQLYLRDPVASVTRPVQELKGFVRLTLQPGEARQVAFEVPVALTGFYDRRMAFVVEPGVVEVSVGGASDDVRLAGSFTVTGATTPVARKVFASGVTVS